MNLYDKFIKWYDNSGVFECYFKSTPFTTLKDYLLDITLIENVGLDDNNIQTLEKLNKLKVFNKENSIYMIDLPGEDSVDYAYLLNNNYYIKPILSYNNIFNKYGIVGSRELASKLLHYADTLIQHGKYKSYSFIMDFNRYIDDIDLDNPTLYNNQYEVTEEEFPYAEILQDLNIKKVIFITKEIIKQDVNNYLNYLQENNVEIEVIKLSKI
ncbi:hypothetical protein [Clostridium cellulovorans]|uniref:Normocyte-binding protein n=1 Tax=Clostridium cellulovorans (strain ATCC 35296 / DSM 3052 / OCM 3 / 743B) TaxID=573061 RepID=D9SV78_CLOC7|nr:hypothetical protein [Clostridium cellulovorans]ADL53052.1 hypothetical protein Clocel_3373 [Clostridium cellulovorans 743B]